MKVRIEFYASLREKFGIKEIEVEAINLKEALQAASKVLGEEFLKEIFDNGDLRRDKIIILNGEIIRDTKKSITLKNGDKIAILPPLIGGIIIHKKDVTE